MLSADRYQPDADATSFRAHAASGNPAGFTGPTQRLIAVRQSGRRTRRTVDLTPAQHRALDIWQRDAADRLGVARVTGQEVLTSLIDQLLTDRELSARIMRAIQARR